MQLVSCTNTHRDLTDLVNHGMVKNTRTWKSWERNIILLQNKKILNLYFRWHILRSYRFVAEVTFKLIIKTLWKCETGLKWVNFRGRASVKYFMQTQLLRFYKDNAKVSSLSLLKITSKLTHFLPVKKKTQKQPSSGVLRKGCSENMQ